jgi:hypothetical protein
VTIEWFTGRQPGGCSRPIDQPWRAAVVVRIKVFDGER